MALPVFCHNNQNNTPIVRQTDGCMMTPIERIEASRQQLAVRASRLTIFATGHA